MSDAFTVFVRHEEKFCLCREQMRLLIYPVLGMEFTVMEVYNNLDTVI